MTPFGAQAAFLGAGGCHHHLGANTSDGAGAPPPGTAALRHATIVLPDAAERDRMLTRLQDSGRTPRNSAEGLTVVDRRGSALVIAVA